MGNEPMNVMAEPTGGLATFGLDWHIFLAQLANFAVVLFVLWKWAYTPLLKALEARGKRVEDSLKKADEIDHRLKQVEAERAGTIADAKAQAASVLEKARADAEAMRAEALAKAKDEVAKVVAHGKAQLKADQEAMKRDLQREVAELAVMAATKIAGANMESKSSEAMATEMVVAWAGEKKRV
jgi:F-type H+-transporting ATPase subunit b